MISFTPASPAWSTSGREHLLGVAEVLGHRAARVPPDEGADGRAAEQGGGVDAAVHVLVDRRRARPGRGRGCCRSRRATSSSRPWRSNSARIVVGLLLAEAVDVEVGRDEGPVAEVGPGRHLERLEALGRRPVADVGQAPLGQAGGEEPELHGRDLLAAVVRRRRPPSRWLRADRSTASVMRTARAPSAKVGSPSTLALSTRRRSPAGCRRRRRRSSPGSPAGGRAGRWRRRAAVGSSWFGSRSTISDGAAPPDPEGVGVLLVEGQRGVRRSTTSKPQLVLVAGRDLAHHHRAAHPGDGAEQHERRRPRWRPAAARPVALAARRSKAWDVGAARARARAPR